MGDSSETAAAGAAAAAAAPAASAAAPAAELAATHSGHVSVLMESSSFLSKRAWRRLYLVLDAGSLSLHDSSEGFAVGRSPLHRIAAVRCYALRTATSSPLPAGGMEGADVALEPGGAATDNTVWRLRCQSAADVEAWVRALRSHGVR